MHGVLDVEILVAEFGNKILLWRVNRKSFAQS